MDTPRRFNSSDLPSCLRIHDADITIASVPEALGDDERAYALTPVTFWYRLEPIALYQIGVRTELPTVKVYFCVAAGRPIFWNSIFTNSASLTSSSQYDIAGRDAGTHSTLEAFLSLNFSKCSRYLSAFCTSPQPQYVETWLVSVPGSYGYPSRFGTCAGCNAFSSMYVVLPRSGYGIETIQR